MIRRLLWLVAGVVLGASGTLWLRRRIERLAQRLRPTRVATDVSSGLEQAVRSTSGRVRGAVDGGRRDARAREDQLRRDFRLGDPVA